MTDYQETQAAEELDALMGRVRDAIARRRDRGSAELPPPISLDGIVRRQTELNDVVVRAIEMLSSQIAGLAHAVNAKPVAAPSTGGNRIAELEKRIATLEGMVEALEQRPEPDVTTAVEEAAATARSAQQRIARLTAMVEAAASRSARANVERSRRLREVEDALARLPRLTAALEEEIAAIAAEAKDARAAADRAEHGAQAALATFAHVDVVEEKLAARLDEIRMRVLRAERDVREQRGAAAVAAPEAAIVTPEPPAFDYFMFEHRFRGTGDDIRRRQAKYVELFAGGQNVLDVGCGRGEFLQTALRHGVGVTGIDRDDDMVAFCRDLGLPAVRADLFAYLAALPERSLDGLFCAQVVEHIEPKDLMRLVHLAATRLRPGAPVLFETVNPHCALALGNFFLDPTHVRPVPPLMLRFVLEQSLFTVNTLRFSSPVPGHTGAEMVEGLDPLPADVHVYQDYAALAVRA